MRTNKEILEGHTLANSGESFDWNKIGNNCYVVDEVNMKWANECFRLIAKRNRNIFVRIARWLSSL